MKLYDTKIEMRALRTLTDSTNNKARSLLASKLNNSFFYDEAALSIYKRIASITRKEGAIPSWEDLVGDPYLDEAAKEEIQNFEDMKPAKSSEKIALLYDNINRYRKGRIVYFNAEKVMKTLSDDVVDIDGLIENSSEALLRAQLGTFSEAKVTNIGLKDNSDEILERLLSKKKKKVIPTGFYTYDKRNGGFQQPSLVIIAATSGGGKSAMANQLGINMSSAGFKVCLVPLEMTDEETMARTVANVARVDVMKYLFTKITTREEKKTRSAWAAFQKELKRVKGAFRIWEPEEDVSMEEILTMRRPYDDDVIIVDYIGLLKGVDGDDSWRQLGNAARYAKVWSKNNKKVVIILAQLSDEGAIRYSRAIKEHANNMWSWTYTDENRETGLIDIVQQKSRNQEAFDFQLGHDFSTMRMFDLDETDESGMEDRRSTRGSKKRRKLKRASDDSDLDSYLEDANG
jgi:replicative DNA helicase